MPEDNDPNDIENDWFAWGEIKKGDLLVNSHKDYVRTAWADNPADLKLVIGMALEDASDNQGLAIVRFKREDDC